MALGPLVLCFAWALGLVWALPGSALATPIPQGVADGEPRPAQNQGVGQLQPGQLQPGQAVAAASCIPGLKDRQLAVLGTLSAKALELRRQGRYAEALSLYQAASQIAPSPTWLYLMAEVHKELQKPTEGLRLLAKAASLPADQPGTDLPFVPRYPIEIAGLQKQLQGQQALLSLHQPSTRGKVPRQVLLDGTETTQNEVALDPGPHIVELREGTEVLDKQQVQLAPSQTHSLALSEPSKFQRFFRKVKKERVALSGTLAGLGLASLVTSFVLSGLHGQSRGACVYQGAVYDDCTYNLGPTSGLTYTTSFLLFGGAALALLLPSRP